MVPADPKIVQSPPLPHPDHIGTHRRRVGGCPWWLWLLIGLIGFLLLLGLIAGLISLFSGNKDDEKVVHRPHG